MVCFGVKLSNYLRRLVVWTAKEFLENHNNGVLTVPLKKHVSKSILKTKDLRTPKYVKYKKNMWVCEILNVVTEHL